MAYEPLTYRTDGGDKIVIASGGTIDVESGGIFAIAGTTVTATATEINALGTASSGTSGSTFTVDEGNATGTFILTNTTGGTDNSVTLQTTQTTTDRVLTLPDATGTLATTSDTWTDVDLGASGTAGTLDIFPTTASKGKLAFACTDNSADHTVSITNEAFGQASTIKIPDPGGAAGQFVVTDEDQTVIITPNSADRAIDISGDVTLAGDLTTAANLTFSGAFAAEIAVPDASTWTLPAGGGTLTVATGAETGTSSNTFTVDSDCGTGKFRLLNTTGGTNHTITLQTSTTTAARTITLPDSTTTLAGLATAQTFTGNQVITGTLDVQGNVSASTSDPNIDLSGSTGTFLSPSGANTLSGDVEIAAGKDLSMAVGAGAIDWSGATGTFATPTGAATLSGDVTLAANKDLTAAAGTGAIDLSGATGVFKTPTGTNTIGGTVSLAANKNVACAAGTTAVDWSLGTGAFKSTTGANQLSGAVTVADATTPSVTLASGKTNSGYFQANGKTNGAIKVLPIDSGTNTLTISQEAQTQACTMLVPDLNVATGQFVCNNADQTVTFASGAADRTVTLAGDVTTANDLITSGNFSLTLTTTASTDVTLPTTGTLASIGGTETLTNKTIDGDDNTIQDLLPSSNKNLVEGLTATTAEPAIPFVVTFKPTNGAGETIAYTVPAGKTLRVLDVRGYKCNGNGGAGDTVTIKNVGNAITDAIDLQINDLLVFEAASYDDGQRDVAATTALNCVTAFNTDCACSVNVLCAWV